MKEETKVKLKLERVAGISQQAANLRQVVWSSTYFHRIEEKTRKTSKMCWQKVKLKKAADKPRNHWKYNAKNQNEVEQEFKANLARSASI